MKPFGSPLFRRSYGCQVGLLIDSRPGWLTVDRLLSHPVMARCSDTFVQGAATRGLVTLRSWSIAPR